MFVATRTPGRLREPAMVSLTAREWDETRIELDALRHDAIEHCDYAEPRLSWMHPVAVELGPQVEQVVAGVLYSLARLRKRASA